jgi:hypothetical protein
VGVGALGDVVDPKDVREATVLEPQYERVAFRVERGSSWYRPSPSTTCAGSRAESTQMTRGSELACERALVLRA